MKGRVRDDLLKPLADRNTVTATYNEFLGGAWNSSVAAIGREPDSLVR